MPWTFAHVAAVIPLKKAFPKKAYFLGLVVGSVAPDFGYYSGMVSLSHFSHSLTGLFIACIPIGLLLISFLVFTGRSFSRILPDPHRAAFRSLINIEKIKSLKHALILMLAIFVGAATHLVWDSFTHAGRWGVAHSELLKSEIIRIGTLKLYGYSLLQHISSILGTCVLLKIYIRWINAKKLSLFSTSRGDRLRYLLLACLFLLSLLIALPISYLHTKHLAGELGISALIVDLAFVFTSVFFTLSVISAFCFKFFKIKHLNE